MTTRAKETTDDRRGGERDLLVSPRVRGTVAPQHAAAAAGAGPSADDGQPSDDSSTAGAGASTPAGQHDDIVEQGAIYLRPSKAPELFGISRATVYRMARRGELTIHKRGKISLVLVSELRAALEGRAA